MRNKKLQEEIARKIIVQAGICAMIPCVLLIGVFAFMYFEAAKTEVDMAFFQSSLLYILLATFVLCGVLFFCIYLIARNVAKDSIRPLQEALEREKSFTDYASHEFRTPLAVLKGSMEVLIRKPRTEEEYRRKIRENLRVVDGMNTMVDNLLMITRVEKGDIKLQPADCSIQELFTEICSAHADEILKRNLHIRLSVEPEELTVRTDYNALAIIVNNLVSNAIKYGNEGGDILLKGFADKEKRIIIVENTGRGIPDEDCDKVFRQFYRSINAGHQEIKGFGLGLAVVHKFADTIGASVRLKSSLNGPTTVEVRLG